MMNIHLKSHYLRFLLYSLSILFFQICFVELGFPFGVELSDLLVRHEWTDGNGRLVSGVDGLVEVVGGLASVVVDASTVNVNDEPLSFSVRLLPDLHLFFEEAPVVEDHLVVHREEAGRHFRFVLVVQVLRPESEDDYGHLLDPSDDAVGQVEEEIHFGAEERFRSDFARTTFKLNLPVPGMEPPLSD